MTLRDGGGPSCSISRRHYHFRAGADAYGSAASLRGARSAPYRASRNLYLDYWLRAVEPSPMYGSADKSSGIKDAASALDMVSRGCDIMSCNVDMMRPVKKSGMLTSKAFRCSLPSNLRGDQVCNIRDWAYLHCAQSSIFRDDRGVVVLVGVKDSFRTAASYGRTIRTALRRLCIDVRLRGRWCTLITPREAMSVCATDTGQHDAARDTPVATRTDGLPDEDIRVVTLQ